MYSFKIEAPSLINTHMLHTHTHVTRCIKELNALHIFQQFFLFRPPHHALLPCEFNCKNVRFIPCQFYPPLGTKAPRLIKNESRVSVGVKGAQVR